MSKCFEDRSECPEVEKFIWDHIAFDFHDFAGVKELTPPELLILRALVDKQISLKVISYD